MTLTKFILTNLLIWKRISLKMDVDKLKVNKNLYYCYLKKNKFYGLFIPIHFGSSFIVIIGMASLARGGYSCRQKHKRWVGKD